MRNKLDLHIIHFDKLQSSVVLSDGDLVESKQIGREAKCYFRCLSVIIIILKKNEFICTPSSQYGLRFGALGKKNP